MQCSSEKGSSTKLCEESCSGKDMINNLRVDAKCKHCWPPEGPEIQDSSSGAESESSLDSEVDQDEAA